MVRRRDEVELERGALLEIALPGGGHREIVYLGELGDDLGETIYVAPADPADEGFIAFYSAKYAAWAGLLTLKGKTQEKVPELPSMIRERGRISRDGTVETWIVRAATDRSLENSTIVEGGGLSVSQLRLPIAEIWNHGMLELRLEEGWSPRCLG